MNINLRTALFLAGILLIVSSSCVWAHTNVTVQQAKDLIDSVDDLVVVDVREESEYCGDTGHIQGALNYPWNSGVLRARYEELPMNVPILVVCQSGGRSNQAANFLDSEGFTEIYDMLGGMSSWLWETVPCVEPDAKYSGGSGTADDPYQIATAEDLITLGETTEDYDKHFILTADIDLDPNLPGGQVFDKAVIASYVPTVGHDRNGQNISFNGVFNGNDHKILNLTIEGESYLGLFGRLDSGINISNLGLEMSDVNGTGDYVGSLAGFNSGSIETSYSTGKVNGNNCVGGLVGQSKGNGGIIQSYSTCNVNGISDVGGLVGDNLFGSIAFSNSTGSVSGISSIGGLAGRNYSGSITVCYSTGVVTGSGYGYIGGLVGANDYGYIAESYSTGTVIGDIGVGGLVGSNVGNIIMSCSTSEVNGESCVGGLIGNDSDGKVANCYSTGSVGGSENVGGLIGCIYHTDGSVTNCYSTGSVSGSRNVGGLVGLSPDESIVIHCFWDKLTSGQTESAGGEDRTTAQMQMAAMFIYAGWDFVNETENGTEDIWWIDEGNDYPRLWWEPNEVEQPLVGELDETSFDAFIADGVVLVDFYATWCSCCTTQAPIIEEVAEIIKDQARVAKLDVDNAPAITQRYEINAIPTLILFRDGVEVQRFVGVTSADILVAAIMSEVDS